MFSLSSGPKARGMLPQRVAQRSAACFLQRRVWRRVGCSPQRVSRRRAICFPWRVAQKRLIWCSYSSVRSGQMLFVLPCTWCVYRRHVYFVRAPKACGNHVPPRAWTECVWCEASQRVNRRRVVCSPPLMTRRRLVCSLQRVARRRVACFVQPAARRRMA